MFSDICQPMHEADWSPREMQFKYNSAIWLEKENAVVQAAQFSKRSSKFVDRIKWFRPRRGRHIDRPVEN